MKMIRAIIRLEREPEVLKRLEAEGFYAVTRMGVLGRGQQRGVQVGPVVHEELAKRMLLLVVEDNAVERAIEAIESGARLGYPGDGKVFVQKVREVFTVRTGRNDL